MKPEYDKLVDGLQGIPLTNLVENWSFTIEEIAPYVFRAQGLDTKWHKTVGYGSTAEDALNFCVKNAKKINLRETRSLYREQALLKLVDKILKIFRKKK